jgi:hypothetical protein
LLGLSTEDASSLPAPIPPPGWLELKPITSVVKLLAILEKYNIDDWLYDESYLIITQIVVACNWDHPI